MSYLHARHIVHGDLKTANVLLSTCESAPFGRMAKVTDFGISRALQVSRAIQWRSGICLKYICVFWLGCSGLGKTSHGNCRCCGIVTCCNLLAAWN